MCSGGFVSAVQVVLESTCSKIVANRSYRRRFRWFIGDGLGSLLATVIGDSIGGLSATDWVLIGDDTVGYRQRLSMTDWVLIGDGTGGFFWDRGGLGSFGNEGEGLGENRKK